MKRFAIIVCVLLAAGPVGAQTPGGAAEPWTAPRTPDGRPDLQGIWTTQTFTPLQRPDRFAGQEFLTEEEAAQLTEVLTAQGVDPLRGGAFAQALAEDDAEKRRDTTIQTDPTHYDNAMWLRTTRPKGLSSRRTSLIVDPCGIVSEEFLVEYAVDRVSTTGTVWLGLTLGCARCHDHKFDPITQKEFYEVAANFNNIPERGKAFKYVNSPPLVTAPTVEQQAELDELDAGLLEARSALAALDTEAAAARTAWEASLVTAGVVDWSLRDGLLAYHAFEGDLAGIQTTTAIPAVLEDGQPQFVEGRIGSAASFDGQRLVNAGASPNLGYDDAFSLAAWIYPTAVDGVIVSRASGGDQGEVGWGLYLERGKVRLNLSTRVLDDGVAAETVADVALDEWQHVLATYDGSKTPDGMRVYINGVSQELTPLLDLVGNRLPQRYPLRIGASGSDKPRFQGHIDDVRIYEGVLTSELAAVVATAEPVSEIARLAPGERSAAQSEKLRLAFFSQYAPPEILQAWRQVGELERQRKELWATFPTVMVMEELAERRPTFRLNRGAYDLPAEEVFPGVPAVLPPLPDGVEANRLSFARWLVDPGHPPPYRPSDGEPVLADVLRDRSGEDVGEFRYAGRVPEPSGAAGLVGNLVHRFRLGRAGTPTDDRDERHLPAVVEGDPGAVWARPRESVGGTGTPSAAPGGDDSRSGTGRLGPARREDRRALGEAVSAGRHVGRHGRRRLWRLRGSRGAASRPESVGCRGYRTMRPRPGGSSICSSPARRRSTSCGTTSRRSGTGPAKTSHRRCVGTSA